MFVSYRVIMRGVTRTYLNSTFVLELGIIKSYGHHYK